MIRMKIPFTGGCACGAIRYECWAEPLMMFKCHCRDCHHVTGGGFVARLLVPASALRLTQGRLRYHFTPSAAGGSDFNYDFHVTLDESVAPLEYNYRAGLSTRELEHPITSRVNSRWICLV